MRDAGLYDRRRRRLAVATFLERGVTMSNGQGQRGGRLARIACAAAMATACAATYAGSTPDPDETFRQRLSHLSAHWWQRATSIPTSVSPLSDATGDLCMLGDSGPVWFLYGTLGAGNAVRSCSIPADRALFFPVFNEVDVNSPNVCGQGAASLSIADLRAAVAPFVDAAKVAVHVDGHRLQSVHRVKSVPFSVVMPADNIFVAPCGGKPTDSPAGVYSPAVDDGYYAFVPPLPPGAHTIHIQATSGTVSLDVTYHLTVVPVDLAD